MTFPLVWTLATIQNLGGGNSLVWDILNDNYLLEKNGGGSTSAVYASEPARCGELASQNRSGTASYFHFDGQGSTRALTDVSQNVTDSAKCSAFGEQIASTGSTTNPFKYVGAAGYYTDSQTSDMYVRARTYQPVIARWLSRDPIGIQSTHEHNLYCYPPINRVDPSGLRPDIDVKGPSDCVSNVLKAMDTICATIQVTGCTIDTWIGNCFDEFCSGKTKITVLCPEELTVFGKLKCSVSGAQAHTWPIGTAGPPTVYLCEGWDTWFGDEAECLLMHELVHGCGFVRERIVDSCDIAGATRPNAETATESANQSASWLANASLRIPSPTATTEMDARQAARLT